MRPEIILLCMVLYFGALFLIAWITGKNATNEGYFIGNRQSPWYAVAFGLIGDSLSGVTFVSVPGKVANDQFSYMQMVLGYVPGYLIIALVLMPLFYRLKLTSIYSFLGTRLGTVSQKTGSFFFIISRLIGAAFRLYISAIVLQLFIFDNWGIPFYLTVTIVILLILLYTFKGGIKTLVWTDTLQSGMLLIGVILSIIAISSHLNLSFSTLTSTIVKSDYSKIFFWDWHKENYFFKQFISGALIAVVMTGLDQNMMQKNLSMKSLPEAQKNLYWFSGVLVLVNLFFVSLGALLYTYATQMNIELPIKTDYLFPMLALNHLGTFAAIAFILGITAATFSSADSVLTTLTTSFCIDYLGFDENKEEEKKQKRIRHLVHILFAVLLLFTIVVFKEVNNDSVINAVFRVAGYTYGPLLGLFAFSLFTKWNVRDRLVPIICIISPILSYGFYLNSENWFSGYKFGFELLLLNGIITFIGLMLIRRKTNILPILN